LEKQRVATNDRSFWEEISYGNGNQFFPKSSEYFNPKFLQGFNSVQMTVLECLTFIAWKRSDWIVRAAVSFLEEGLSHRRIKSGAIKRHLRTWRSNGLVRLVKKDSKNGNLYLVAPMLLQEPKAGLMAHFAEAKLLYRCWLDLNDPTRREIDSQMDLLDPTDGSFRSISENSARLQLDLNDPHSIDIRSLLDVAPRYSPITSEGGVVGPEKRSPNGQDQGIGGATKGVLTDKIKKEVHAIQLTGSPVLA
jgi:hypothetical protein